MVEFQQKFEIPREHPVYPGHFPGDPMVPAALLMDWMKVRIERVFPATRVIGAASVKFLSPVRPGDSLALAGQCSSDTGKLSLTLNGDLGPVLKAIFLLEDASS